MAVICSVDLETARKYTGNIKTKYNGVSHQVLFRVMCDDNNVDECIKTATLNSNIIMLDYRGREPVDTSCYIGTFVNTFDDVPHTPKGVVPIVMLDDDYSDIRYLYDFKQLHPNVRFCGGNLFALDSLGVGAVGVDILKSRGIKVKAADYSLHNRIDAVDEVDINSIEITTGTVKSGSAKSTSSSKDKDSTPKPKKPKVDFSAIFSAFT